MDFLNRIENLLDMPPGQKAEVLRELTSHYWETCQELLASGMDPAAVRAEAAQRLGTPYEIAARLNAAHNSASWKSALLCVVPFAASAMYLATSAVRLASGVRFALLIAIGVVMLAASARELLRGRRPIWLATWLAAGLVCIPGLLYPLGGEKRLLVGASAILLLVALVELACGLVRRWLTLVTITSALAALSTACVLLDSRDDSVAWLPVMTMILTSVVLIVLFARLVFEAHPYGSGTRASLFLLTVFVLRFSAPTNAGYAWIDALPVVLCGLAIVWFARVPERASKARASFFALLTVAVWSQVASLWRAPVTVQVLSAIIFALVIASICQLIVTWPMRCEETERDRLTIAR